jgi:phytanoyl-CoA hydroxylase
MTETQKQVLDREQVDRYERDGYLLLEDALSPWQLARLDAVFEAWVEESRSHDGPYGETFDGRPRFDVEPGHCAERPALRRVASPIEVSDAYLEVMRANPALDAVAQLIGPNLRFRESKVNSKLPGTATHLKFHQDLPFGPLTNEDLITVLFHLDEVTAENGPLEVVPGSHRGPLYEHWHDGVFTGAVSPEVEAMAKEGAVTCCGAAGSAYLLDARLLHGSAPNLSSAPRTLFIVQYHAEDAYPLAPNHLPSRFDGDVVAGVATNRVRCSDYEVAVPEMPTAASFFAVQAAGK